MTFPCASNTLGYPWPPSSPLSGCYVRALCSKPDLHFSLDLNWQLQKEATASSRRAVQFNFPPMRQDNVACDTQPQSHPLHNAASLTPAYERLKDLFLLMERNTRSRICHLDG